MARWLHRGRRDRHGGDGGATRPRRDHGHANAGEAGDTMHAGGLQRFGEAHLQQHGGQPARQHRRPHARSSPEQRSLNRSPPVVFR